MKKNKITVFAIIAVLVLGLLVLGCSSGGSDNNNGGNSNSGDTVNAVGKIIILQAYGNAGDGSPAGVSHSFVELYNISDKAINLDGIKLYYANGIRGADVTEDEAWKSITLTGTIPAKGSFLVLGAKHSNVLSTRYKMPDNSGDINDDNLSLSRRSFKVALISGSAELTAQNPFTSNDGQPVSGYIDMVGAANAPEDTNPDNIFGYESAPARNSASEAVRRRDLTDSDNNKNDFTSARYALSGDDAFTDEMLEVRKPRNSSAGAWNPFEQPAEPIAPDNPTVAGAISENAGKLLIWQVGAATDGAITRSFVELYNNSGSSIDLKTYSIQYANTTGTSWNVINLIGTIPANGSYLVIGPEVTITDDSRLYITEADQTIDDFVLNNRNFKIALMANQNVLTVENPFDMTGGKAKDYVDLLGAKNGNSDNIDAFETASAQVISKQASARRKSLTDNNNNSTDFERIDYRVKAGSNGISDDDVVKYRPRSSVYGEWNPVTGVKKDKPPTGVKITGTGISSGKLGLIKDAVVTLSSTVTPVDSDATGATYSWAVSNESETGVITYSEANKNTFGITAAKTGTATISLTVNGGKISGSVTNSIQVTVSTGTSMLMILQVFGMHANNDSAPTHSFIELYNNTSADIDLSTYSVHWANGPSNNANAPAEKDVWHKINLTGSIPANSSYLILGAQVVDTATIANSSSNGKLDLTTTTADFNEPTFLMSNRSYKVALMSNQADITVANPWGDEACIDLVSAINTTGQDSVTAAKGATDLTAVNGATAGANTISKQKAYRRTSLTVSNVTLTDFTSKSYNNISDGDIAKFRPRATANGSYIPQF
jgi:hypothetical protein